jgi:1,4-dihydroxy-2-naphthoate octaprenyltransferase
VTLLLYFLAGMVVLGFATERLTGRLYLVIAVASVAVTCLYYFPHRVMT